MRPRFPVPGATTGFLALCPGSLADGLCLLQFGLHFWRAQHKQLLPFGNLLPLLDVHLFDAAGDFRRNFDTRRLYFALDEIGNGLDREPADQRNGDDDYDDADSQSDYIALFHIGVLFLLSLLWGHCHDRRVIRNGSALRPAAGHTPSAFHFLRTLRAAVPASGRSNRRPAGVRF